jgi:hypothetical protein
MSGKSNEERKKEFLKLQAEFRELVKNLKAAHQKMIEDRKVFQVMESENVRVVVCKN